MKTKSKLFENIQGKSEKTYLKKYEQDGDMEPLRRKEAKEEGLKRQILEKKQTIIKLQDSIREHPGIIRQGLAEMAFSEISLRLLSDMRSVYYRKPGYFSNQ